MREKRDAGATSSAHTCDTRPRTPTIQALYTDVSALDRARRASVARDVAGGSQVRRTLRIGAIAGMSQASHPLPKDLHVREVGEKSRRATCDACDDAAFPTSRNRQASHPRRTCVAPAVAPAIPCADWDVAPVAPCAFFSHVPIGTPAYGSAVSPQTIPTEAPTDWYGTELPPEVAAHPLLDEAAWIALRDSGRKPLDESDLPSSYQSRAEFLVGAWIIDKIVPPRSGGSLLNNLQPQMLREADVLAAERRRNAILMPRRSAKTTTLWCVLLGRCWMRPMHMAAYTMMTLAKKAEERFELDVRNPIRSKWKDPKTRPIKLLDGKGGKGIEFPNDSKLSILAPKGEDIRSGAYDTVIMDEAGEAEPEDWDEIVGAVIPSFDTRPGSQLIYAGTGGKYRDGSHFWKTLHDDKAGRIRYGVPDDIAESALESWDAGAGALIERLHPGLDGLTTLEVIEDNYPDLGAQRFALEYLGHFGKDSGNAVLLSANDWQATLQEGDVPEGIKPLCLGFAVHLGGAWASVAVGWHVPDPTPPDLVQLATDEPEAPPLVAVKLVHHQSGNANLARTLLDLWRRTKLPIVYDDSPQEKAVIEEIHRLARRARLHVKTDIVHYQEKAVATTKLLNGIAHKRVLHWAQAPLDEAARIATPRLSGKARLIGAADPQADVTPLDATALVLLRMPEQETQINPRTVLEFS